MGVGLGNVSRFGRIIVKRLGVVLVRKCSVTANCHEHGVVVVLFCWCIHSSMADPVPFFLSLV